MPGARRAAAKPPLAGVPATPVSMRKLFSYIITSFFLIAGAPPLEYVGNPLDNTTGGRRGLHWFESGIDRDLAA